MKKLSIVPIKKDFSAFKRFIKSKHALLWIFPLIITITYWIILFLDKEFYYRWLILGLWLVSLIFFLYSSSTFKTRKPSLSSLDPQLLLVVATAIFISFFELKNIPFVTIGDMLRDGGLDAITIITGETKNIFAYGRYESHGLIIPTFSAIFHFFFGDSAMIFKVASAVIAVLDAILLYLLMKKYINSKSALIASLILILTPLHLYYGRTEIVVIFSSLLTTVLLLSLYRFLNLRSLSNIIILSLTIGFSLNFHASVKTVSYLTLLIVAITVIYYTLKDHRILPIFGKGLLILVFVIIGFGPRLKFTTPEILLHTRTITAQQEDTESNDNFFPDPYFALSEKYPKSLMVYFYEETTSHFSDFAPLQPFSFSLFFIIGLIFLMKNLDNRSLIAIYALILPLTNSALTDAVNGDHRLAPLLPVSAIVIAYGTHMFIQMFKTGELRKYLLSLFAYSLISLNLAINFYRFFYVIDVGAQAYNPKPEEEYLITYTNQILQSEVEEKNVCLHLSDKVYEIFDIMHYKETFKFYNIDKDVKLYLDDTISSSTVYVTKDCNSNISELEYIDYTYCENFTRYICPKETKGLRIKIENTL